MAMAMALVILAAISMLWIMRAGHPLWPPDEGRYGSVSMHMAGGEGWIVPQRQGQPHLTKPPLTYWAQAWGLKILGHHELAVRGPSLLASSLMILILLGVGWRIGGPVLGVIAAGLLSLMPLHVGASWLAITDPMLALFWFAALACGYFAVQERRARWTALMWIAIALGLLTKGPLALTPIGVLLLWLLISSRRREAWRLGIPIGLPASLIPVAIWVAMVINTRPEAVNIWLHETVGRTVGSGAHPEAWWYYIPYFFAGLFPATAMMTLPGWNIRFKMAWEKIRNGEAVCLWALAVIAPLVMFTSIAGKLPTYILPLAAPMALLTAMMLHRWLTGEADHPTKGMRPPDVVVTVTVCVTVLLLAVAGAVVTMLQVSALWMIAPLLLLPLSSGWMWFNWKRRPSMRSRTMLLVWAAGIVCWCWALRLEQHFFEPHSARTMMEKLPAVSGVAQPRLATYGFDDPTLAFYSQRDVPPLSSQRLLEPLNNPDGAMILLASDDDWQAFTDQHPQRAAMFVHLDNWSRWPDHKTLILRPPNETGGP